MIAEKCSKFSLSTENWRVSNRAVKIRDLCNLLMDEIGTEIWNDSWINNLEFNSRPRTHYAGDIWKRHFYSENPSNVFRPHYAGGISKRNNHQPFWICVWGKRGQENHLIIVLQLFSKNPVFKMFSVHIKTQNQRFQIPPVWRAFSKSSVFVTD